MTFHPIRFPLDISLGARGGPERATDVVTLAGRNATRAVRMRGGGTMRGMG